MLYSQISYRYIIIRDVFGRIIREFTTSAAHLNALSYTGLSIGGPNFNLVKHAWKA